VYISSLLVAKKRYVGNKIENNQFTLDAKGLEIIRRDGFPAL
jgi:DNA polymerase zeta